MNDQEQKEFDEFFDLVGTQEKKKILIPLIKRFDPRRLAKTLCDVQPMNPNLLKDLHDAVSGKKKK